MRSALTQNMVQAGGGSDIIGQIAGSLVSSWGNAKAFEAKTQAREDSNVRLAAYKHQLGLDRDTHKANTAGAAKMAANVLNDHIKTTFENLQSGNRKDLFSHQEKEKQGTYSAKSEVDLDNMRKLTESQHLGAGREYVPGSISSNIIKPSTSAAHPTGLSYSAEGMNRYEESERQKASKAAKEDAASAAPFEPATSHQGGRQSFSDYLHTSLGSKPSTTDNTVTTPIHARAAGTTPMHGILGTEVEPKDNSVKPVNKTIKMKAQVKPQTGTKL